MILLMLFVVIVLLVIVEILRELNCFRVVRYDIRSDKIPWSGSERVKAVFLSDLHNQSYGRDNEKLLAAVRRENPDVILIGGDMLVGKAGHDYGCALQFVKKLVHIGTVYYANGNHEQRMKERPEKYEQSFDLYKNELREAGVHFLENSYVHVDKGQIGFNIYGIEIPKRCYRHLKKEKMEVEEIQQRIGTCDRKEYNILLAHNPGYAKEYMEWGADLILSGHLHGGIVRIPGLTGVVAPNLELFPKYSGGRYKEKNKDIIVSRGLGTHTIRVRLFNPAELVVFTL